MQKRSAQQRAEFLIEALPYIQQFRGQTFVIKYGGSAMDDEHAVDRLLRDIVFLEAVGINPVVVHGGGKAITARMREEGLQAKFVAGLRVTDERSIKIVEEVLDGQINPGIVETIRRFGGKACGFSGRAIIRAMKLPPQREGRNAPVDVGFVGDVTGVDVSGIVRAVAEEMVPVISPLGADETGQVLNVNADVAAGAIAGELRAGKLVYLSDVPGIMRDTAEATSLIPSVTREMIQRLVADEVIAGGMLPKVDSAVGALDRGVGKVHFIDGRVPHSLLLEVFTNSGIGTEILP